MRNFHLEKSFGLDAADFYDAFLLKPDFFTFFHQSKGDKDVVVSDWMTCSSVPTANSSVSVNILSKNQNPPISQRVCIFTMIEPVDSNEFERTRCMERQTLLKLNLHPKINNEIEGNCYDDEEILLKTSLIPEHSSGGTFFRIDSLWKIISARTCGELAIEKGCLVIVDIEIECSKKIWGVTSIMENYVESQFRSSFDKWFTLALQKSNSYLEEKLSSSPHGGEVVSDKLEEKPVEDENEFIRLRMSALKRVVNGTEKLCKMLHSLSLRRASLSERSTLQISESGRETRGNQSGNVVVVVVENNSPEKYENRHNLSNNKEEEKEEKKKKKSWKQFRWRKSSLPLLLAVIFLFWLLWLVF